MSGGQYASGQQLGNGKLVLPGCKMQGKLIVKGAQLKNTGNILTNS